LPYSVTFPCCRYERTIFGFACERTRGAWIHACDTTVQYRFVSHCCDVILLCIVWQISNKFWYPHTGTLRSTTLELGHNRSDAYCFKSSIFGRINNVENENLKKIPSCRFSKPQFPELLVRLLNTNRKPYPGNPTVPHLTPTVTPNWGSHPLE